MGQSVPLPVIVPPVSGQRWACHSCGDCCRTLVVHLTGHDRRVIDEQDWSKELEVAPYVRLGRGWALNKRADGACVFLDENNRCRIHARHGSGAKPLACRAYPFSLRRVENGWQSSLRYDCPSALLSRGDPLSRQRSELGAIAKDLAQERMPNERPVMWQRSVPISLEERNALDRNMLRWLGQDEPTMTVRLLGAVRLTSTLFGANLKRVRGARGVELLDLLFGALSSEAVLPAAPASDRQHGFLRQIAYAHSEHLSLTEARKGWGFSMGRRLDQLKRARAFRTGQGVVPPMPGFDGASAFENVERVRASKTARDEIEGLILRYLTARIEGRSVYGSGYYDWPVVVGYAALWLALGAVGWLARYNTAISGRDELNFADVAGALAIVDRAATRLPALGTSVEKARIAYLVREDGLARLLNQYALVTLEE